MYVFFIKMFSKLVYVHSTDDSVRCTVKSTDCDVVKVSVCGCDQCLRHLAEGLVSYVMGNEKKYQSALSYKPMT